MFTFQSTRHGFVLRLAIVAGHLASLAAGASSRGCYAEEVFAHFKDNDWSVAAIPQGCSVVSLGLTRAPTQQPVERKAGEALGNVGAIALAEATKVARPPVVYLNANNHNIGPEGAVAIAELLSLPSTAIKTLDLSYNPLTNDGISAIAKALKGNTVLTKIILDATKVGEEGAQALLEAAKVNTALKSIALSYNRGIETATRETIINIVNANGNPSKKLAKLAQLATQRYAANDAAWRASFGDFMVDSFVQLKHEALLKVGVRTPTELLLLVSEKEKGNDAVFHELTMETLTKENAAKLYAEMEVKLDELSKSEAGSDAKQEPLTYGELPLDAWSAKFDLPNSVISKLASFGVLTAQDAANLSDKDVAKLLEKGVKVVERLKLEAALISARAVIQSQVPTAPSPRPATEGATTEEGSASVESESSGKEEGGKEKETREEL